MKRIYPAVVLLLFLLPIFSPLRVDGGEPTGLSSLSSEDTKKSQEQRIDKALNTMRGNLDLSADQLKAIKEDLEDQAARIEVSREGPAAGIQEIRADTDRKIIRVLTPAQAEKYGPMKDRLWKIEQQNPKDLDKEHLDKDLKDWQGFQG